MCHIHSIRSIHYQYTLAIHPVNNTSIPPTLSHPSSPPLIPSPHPLPLSSPPLSHRPSGVLGVPRGSPVPGLRGVHPLHLPNRHLPHASGHHLMCALLHRYCWCCCCGVVVLLPAAAIVAYTPTSHPISTSSPPSPHRSLPPTAGTFALEAGAPDISYCLPCPPGRVCGLQGSNLLASTLHIPPS